MHRQRGPLWHRLAKDGRPAVTLATDPGKPDIELCECHWIYHDLLCLDTSCLVNEYNESSLPLASHLREHLPCKGLLFQSLVSRL